MSQNVVVLEEWAAALRGGGFEQGKQQLKTGENEFCCLGVLCQLHKELVGGGRWQKVPDPPPNGCYKYFYEGESDYLSPTVVEWAGLPTSAGVKVDNCSTIDLAVMNDSGKTFEEIADVIDKAITFELSLQGAPNEAIS